MAERIRVAMIGAGINGFGHMKAISELPGMAELVAVADVVPEQVEKAMQEFQIGTSFADALVAASEAEADAVIVSIPNKLHAKVVLAALRSGKHVLVEKPMALTLADAEEMVRTAEERGLRLMVGQSLRFHSPMRKIKQMLGQGAVGRVRHVLHRRMSYFTSRPEDSWFGSQEQSGGVLPGVGSHSIDAILWWLDDAPARVCAEIQSLRPRMDIEDEAAVLLATQRNTMVTMAYSMNYSVGQEWIICGDDGIIRLQGREVVLNDEPQDVPDVIPLDGEPELHAEFLTAIRDGRPLAQASGRQVLPSIAVICGAQESARTGQMVRL